jgi:uncharacterized protein YybS (DUF2232 family)
VARWSILFFIILSALSPYFFYSLSAVKIFLVSLILGVLGAGLFFLTAGKVYLAEGQESFHRALIDSITYYKSRGLPEDKLELLRETVEWLNQTLAKISPALLVMMVAFLAAVNYFLARYLLKKMGKNPPALKPLAHWKFPDRFIWVFIAASLCVWRGRTASLALLHKLGLNFLVLMLTVYLGQGFILTHFFLKKWRWPLVLQLVLYLVFLFQPVFLILIILWGIFEVWFDFRKLEVKEQSR